MGMKGNLIGYFSEDLNYDNYLLKLPMGKCRKIQLGIHDKTPNIGEYLNED